jgi:hypothetical protein
LEWLKVKALCSNPVLQKKKKKKNMPREEFAKKRCKGRFTAAGEEFTK